MHIHLNVSKRISAKTRRALLALAAAAALAFPPAALGQGATTPITNPQITGHVQSADAVPTGTNCTVAAGSTDTQGECTTSSTSGSIAFTKAFVSAPTCVVVDKTSAATVPQVTYTTTTAQITLTTVTSAHVLDWVCFAKLGG